MNTSAPFSSECPGCGQDRVQTGHDREELAELLSSGSNIEAYCVSCDRWWPISEEERADLSWSLTKGSRGSPKP